MQSQSQHSVSVSELSAIHLRQGVFHEHTHVHLSCYRLLIQHYSRPANNGL